MYKLVMLRHGQSLWNLDNRFTGWEDIDLSPKGFDEALAAGKLLQQEGLSFDLAFTSVLKRAIRTLWITLDQMNAMWVPVEKSWQLNERHYGALQGLNKAETAKKYGDDQVFTWRRSYDILPPALEATSPSHPCKDEKYAQLDANFLPSSEALKHTLDRVLPYWNGTIAPHIQAGKKIIITAHGNSLRALVKHLDKVSDEEITKLNIPTGIPLIYELDNDLQPIKHYYLGNPADIKNASAAVANQAKS